MKNILSLFIVLVCMIVLCSCTEDRVNMENEGVQSKIQQFEMLASKFKVGDSNTKMSAAKEIDNLFTHMNGLEKKSFSDRYTSKDIVKYFGEADPMSETTDYYFFIQKDGARKYYLWVSFVDDHLCRCAFMHFLH